MDRADRVRRRGPRGAWVGPSRHGRGAGSVVRQSWDLRGPCCRAQGKCAPAEQHGVVHGPVGIASARHPLGETRSRASTRSPYVSHDHRCHPWAPRVPAISSLQGVVPATTTAVTRCRRMDSRNHASASGGRYLPETYRIMLLRCAVSGRSEEHTSELQSLMRISYAVFCLKKQTPKIYINSILEKLPLHNIFIPHTVQ